MPDAREVGWDVSRMNILNSCSLPEANINKWLTQLQRGAERYVCVPLSLTQTLLIFTHRRWEKKYGRHSLLLLDLNPLNVNYKSTICWDVNPQHFQHPSIHSSFYPIYSPCGLWPLLHFLNLYVVGRTPWTENQTVARQLPTRRINADIHVSSGIVTHDPSVWASQESSCLKRLGHRDRPQNVLSFLIYLTIKGLCILEHNTR
jgi:hypothetical protein